MPPPMHIVTTTNRTPRRRPSISACMTRHAPDIPNEGRDLIGQLREALRRELDQIRDLLTDHEPDTLTLPATQSNTRRATFAYASAASSDRPKLRQQLFAAYWISSANLADPETLKRLGAIHQDEPAATQWRDEWLALPRPIVPVMVLPDGYVSRGLGALAQLAENREHVEVPDTTASEANGKPHVVGTA